MEKRTDINALLNEAMNAEIEAQNFYSQAARKAQSKTGQLFFNELADYEQKHYEKIRGIIEAIKKNEELSTYDLPVYSRSINPEVSGEFEPNKDEIVEVLTLAIKAEQDARERYLKIAAMINDQQGKTIFNNLADDERRHHDLLEAQFYQMSNKGTIIWE